jgi:acetyl esterase
MTVMKFKINLLLILQFLLAGLLFGQTEDLTKYLPEVRAVNKFVSGFPDLDISTPENLAKARAMFANTVKTVLTGQNRVINNVSVRVFRPDTVRAVVLEIHGGGWCLGSAEQDDGPNDAMARACKVAVVSVNYRLSPENAYPAQADDCETILAWLLKNSKSEFGTEKIILSGESAGAHLATVILIRLRNKQENIKNVIGLSLFYGCYDLSLTPSARQNTSVITLRRKEGIQMLAKTFPNKSPEQLRDSTLSPLFANLGGLPPAFFSVGTLDPLIDDSKFMAARWESAGNQTILRVYPECPHIFNRLQTQMGNIANNNVYKWMDSLLK